MNDDQFGTRIRGLLNQGLTLDAAKISRLHESRERALARQRRESWVPAPAWAGRMFAPMGGGARLLLPLVFGILALIAFQYVQRTQIADDIGELDAAVLKGDLPIDAYLDSGFQSWLRKSND